MDTVTRRRRNLHRKIVADGKRKSLIQSIKESAPSISTEQLRLLGSLFNNLPKRLKDSYRKMRRRLTKNSKR